MSLSYRLVLGLILCFEIHCEGGCNYWYVRVPILSTACNLQEGGTAHFTCYIRGICNYTLNVQWYKRINHNISELISGGLHGKYNVHGPNLVNLSNSVNYCYILTDLKVHNFNSSDNGHYWCQIILNHNCLLQPSPHDYIAVSEDTANISQSCTFNRSLHPLKCAEDSVSSSDMRCIPERSSATVIMTKPAITISHSTLRTSISSDMRYIPERSSATVIMIKPTITISHSAHFYNLTTTTITLHDSNNFDREDNMIWLYGVIVTVFLFIIFVLVLGLVVMSLKYRTQQKQTLISHSDKFRLDIAAQDEVSNPHYIKTTCVDINPATKHTNVSAPKDSLKQSETGHNEAQSQSTATDETNDGERHNFAAYDNQEKTLDHSLSSDYAVVNKIKKCLKTDSRVQPTTSEEWYSPGYAEVGEVSSKTVTTTEKRKEQEDISEQKPLKRSPSPVYAEVSKDETKKKKQQHEDHSVVEERQRNPSPKYTVVEKVNKHAKDIVNQEKDVDEQHYYYSLENPEELSCSESNMAETVNTHENSQEPRITLTQNMMTNDNKQTELATVNEVYTSPDSHGADD